MGKYARIIVQSGSKQLVLIITLSMIILGVSQPFQIAHAQHGRFAAASVSLPPMSLTIVALNGTQAVLNENNIGNMPSVRAYGGFKNTVGNIGALGYYTGVALVNLCNIVGGMSAQDGLRVISSDGYNQTLTYQQAMNGDFVTYDNVTGNPIPHNQPLTPMLAYYKNDLNLTYDDGAPLRLVVVSNESIVTDSFLWVKYVTKLEIILSGRNEIAVNAVTPLKTIVGQGYNCSFNVTVSNLGDYEETFSLTLYANTNFIATASNVVLGYARSKTLTFTWNTTGFAYGNYTMMADASPVPGETNLTDNMLTDGPVEITIVGDVNGDGKVNLIDVFAVALAYGSQPGDPRWNPNYDINNDGKINLIDYFRVALNYGNAR